MERSGAPRPELRAAQPWAFQEDSLPGLQQPPRGRPVLASPLNARFSAGSGAGSCRARRGTLSGWQQATEATSQLGRDAVQLVLLKIESSSSRRYPLPQPEAAFRKALLQACCSVRLFLAKGSTKAAGICTPIQRCLPDDSRVSCLKELVRSYLWSSVLISQECRRSATS